MIIPVYVLDSEFVLHLVCLCLEMAVMLKDDFLLLAQKQVSNGQCSPQSP